MTKSRRESSPSRAGVPKTSCASSSFRDEFASPSIPAKTFWRQTRHLTRSEVPMLMCQVYYHRRSVVCLVSNTNLAKANITRRHNKLKPYIIRTSPEMTTRPAILIKSIIRIIRRRVTHAITQRTQIPNSCFKPTLSTYYPEP